MSSGFLDCLSAIPHHKRRLAKGTQLFECADPVRYVYGVDAGEIRLVRRSEDGREFVLQRATAGSVLAEASVMNEGYHCAAVATVDSTVSVWPIGAVRSVIQSDPKAVQAFASLLADEVRNARLRAEILSLRKVSERLDAWLVWNGDKMPEKGNWHRVAQEINVSHEALYRELSRRRFRGLGEIDTP